MMSGTAPLIPVLGVPDLQAACEFYVEKLGFTVEWKYGEPAGYAAVRFGEVSLHLSENADGVSKDRGLWFYMMVDDTDALYAAYEAAGVTVEGPPTVKPWGMREFIAVDLNGYRFHIGQSTEESTED